jgi:hypothetical protein
MTASSTDPELSAFNYWYYFRSCSVPCHVIRDVKGMENAAGKTK